MSLCDPHLHPDGGEPAKRAYTSRGQAEAAIRVIRKKGMRRRGGKPVRTYLCPRCHRWFLTSSPL